MQSISQINSALLLIENVAQDNIATVEKTMSAVKMLDSQIRSLIQDHRNGDSEDIAPTPVNNRIEMKTVKYAKNEYGKEIFCN